MMSREIEKRCRELFQEPALRAKGWRSNLFWRPVSALDPFGSLRVDPWELEVLFCAVLACPSQARSALEAREPGRAGFIERSIAHGELPLLRYREAP
ncbi:MAG: hypothetical protein JJ693_05100 [Acidithiobacillus sp.]|nr:hypothetical protein [Acidithiobacillus sp.]